jgi:hypothetical protein
MSTAAIIPDPNTIATLPISSEVLNYTAIVELDEKGVIQKKSLTTSSKRVETLEAPDYAGKEIIAFKQTVSRPVVGTLAGFTELFPDTDAQLFIINRGLSAFADAKVRSVFLETDKDDTMLVFQSTTGTYDLTADVQDTPARKLTSEETLVASLRKMGVSSDMISQVFASLQANKAAATV